MERLRILARKFVEKLRRAPKRAMEAKRRAPKRGEEAKRRAPTRREEAKRRAAKRKEERIRQAEAKRKREELDGGKPHNKGAEKHNTYWRKLLLTCIERGNQANTKIDELVKSMIPGENELHLRDEQVDDIFRYHMSLFF